VNVVEERLVEDVSRRTRKVVTGRNKVSRLGKRREAAKANGLPRPGTEGEQDEEQRVRRSDRKISRKGEAVGSNEELALEVLKRNLVCGDLHGVHNTSTAARASGAEQGG